MMNTYKNSLAHEREVFGVPQVPIVDSTHQYVGEEDTDVLVDLEPEGVVETV